MENKTIVCIGAALIDETFLCTSQPLEETSNPATYSRSQGGVACNVATHLAMLGNRVELVSCFGNDVDGKWLRDQCMKAGIVTTNSIIDETPTGRYSAILSPDGNLFTAASSCDFSAIAPEFLRDISTLLHSASVVLADCNLTEEALRWITDYCYENKIPCIIEPVSVAKSKKIISCNLHGVMLLTPNFDELAAISENHNGISSRENILLDKGLKYLWIKNGPHGSDLFSKDKKIHVDAPHVNILDATGAGDAALAGWIHAWQQEKSVTDCIRYGHSLASIILQSIGAISEKLNSEILEQRVTHDFEN